LARERERERERESQRKRDREKEKERKREGETERVGERVCARGRQRITYVERHRKREVGVDLVFVFEVCHFFASVRGKILSEGII